MTLIIGVHCTDGIVVAADSAVTMGSALSGLTAEIPVGRKLSVLNDSMIVGFSGYTGLGFRLIETLRENHKHYRTQPTHKAMDKMREYVLPIVQSELTMAKQVHQATGNGNVLQQLYFSMVVALPLSDSPRLITLDTSCSPDLITSDIACVSVGSGQRFADPFLGFVRDMLWPEHECPKLKEGTLGALWAMRHAIRTNTGGVGGDVQVTVLKSDGKSGYRAADLEAGELSEHQEAIEDLEKHIRGWRVTLSQVPTPETTTEPPK